MIVVQSYRYFQIHGGDNYLDTNVNLWRLFSETEPQTPRRTVVNYGIYGYCSEQNMYNEYLV